MVRMTPPSAPHVLGFVRLTDALRGRGCVQQGLDAVGHALGGLPELLDGPVGGVALGDVVVAGVG